MPNPFQEDFEAELAKLRKKPKKWTPPETLDKFLEAVRLVIETSKYKDTYRTVPQAELMLIVKHKIGRVINFQDVEEALDVCGYMWLVFDKLVRQ